VDGLVDLHRREPFALLVIDPLAGILPGNENNASSMLSALAPLERLTERAVSVLVLHHPRKGDPPVGDAPRGSGALSGFADILIDMRAANHRRASDRRRKLSSLSRFAQTPRQLMIEWSADGADYVGLGTFLDNEFARHWKKILAVFATAPHKLIRADICRRWQHGDPPVPITLKRWLRKGVSQGLLLRDGAGTRAKPYRYWTPECEVRWREDPLAWMLMPELAPPNSAAAEAIERRRNPNWRPSLPPPAVRSELVAPEPSPAPVAEPPLAPEPPVRLPYPWNTMKPEEVPAHIWQQARAAR
jgi:hypothetical protein